MKLLYVGAKPCTEETLVDFFQDGELSVSNYSDLTHAIVEYRFANGSYHCMVLEDLAVVKKDAALLQGFLTNPAQIPVVLLDTGSDAKSRLLLISEIEKTKDGFRILLKRISNSGALSSNRCIDTEDDVIHQYQAPCITRASGADATNVTSPRKHRCMRRNCNCAGCYWQSIHS